MREDLFNAIKQYNETATKNGSIKNLAKDERRYVKKVFEEFENGGMKLPPA